MNEEEKGTAASGQSQTKRGLQFVEVDPSTIDETLGEPQVEEQAETEPKKENPWLIRIPCIILAVIAAAMFISQAVFRKDTDEIAREEKQKELQAEGYVFAEAESKKVMVTVSHSDSTTVQSVSIALASGSGSSEEAVEIYENFFIFDGLEDGNYEISVTLSDGTAETRIVKVDDEKLYIISVDLNYGE